MYTIECRNDAGLAAAELMLAIEKHVTESGSLDTVGTVGKSEGKIFMFSLKEFFCTKQSSLNFI